MNTIFYFPKKDNGFVLVVALVMLLVLSLIGIFALNTTDFELQISGNDKVAKESFYEADGGTELMERLTFENAICYNSGGFTATEPDNTLRIGKIKVNNLVFADARATPATYPPATSDVNFFLGDWQQEPQTNLSSYGEVKYSPGSGLQMVSGYEGLGSGAAAGGTHMLYTIYAQHLGALNSESVVSAEWQLSLHLINNASSFDCNY